MTSILIAGVGGQGALLASRVLGGAAIQMGYDVKVSEVHGMSQRGGSVETYVRFDRNKVYSPLIDKGGADIILGFEALEAYRNIAYLKPGGVIIVNTQQISPLPVIIGAASYPEKITEKLRQAVSRTIALDALALAVGAGSAKMVNVVLIGVLAGLTDISKDVWLSVLRETVPVKLLEMNLKAFEAGYAYPKEEWHGEILESVH